MRPQAFQAGEVRDEHDNIIRQGAYGKKTPFATADNSGILDYIINNFDVLDKGIKAAGIGSDENGNPTVSPVVSAALEAVKLSAANAKKSEELAKKYSDMAYDVVADANAISYPTIDIIVGGGSVPDPSSDADNFVMSVVDNKGTLEVTKGNNKTTKISFVKTVNKTAPIEGNVEVQGGGLNAEFITNNELDSMFK